MNRKVLKTLSLTSNFLLDKEDSYKELDEALKCSNFDRCELTLKSSRGYDFFNNRVFQRKLLKCVEVVRRHSINIVFSLAVYENKRNCDDGICVYQADKFGREKIITRICPQNMENRKMLLEMMLDTSERLATFDGDAFLLGYFRYENFNQCVCNSCINKFQSFLDARNKYFSFSNIFDLLEEAIIIEWINWKQQIINEVLSEFNSVVKRPIIVEMDFDETKCYLNGPMIEEGLNFSSILALSNEIFLHIEPCKRIAKFDFVKSDSNERGRFEERYINYIRYIVNMANISNVKLNFLFWALSNKEELKHNLKQYISLVSEIMPKGIVFSTEEPLLLSRYLYQQMI